jgi:hypothetical protein
MNIKPIHYTLRSGRDASVHHLQFWTLKGSLDRSEWIELDRREKNIELNNQRAIAIFPVSCSDSVHMIRLRQLGKNSKRSDYLFVNSIEVFAVLIEPEQ